MTIHQLGDFFQHGSGNQITVPPDSTVIISQVLTFLAVSLILPLYSIATTLFYYDIRIRREGFDLEFMAGQLGEASEPSLAFSAPLLSGNCVRSWHRIGPSRTDHRSGAGERTLSPGAGTTRVSGPRGIRRRYPLQGLDFPVVHAFGAKLGQFKYAEEMPRLSSLLMSVMVFFAVAALGYIMVRLSRRRGELEMIPVTEMPGQKTFRPPESYDEEIRRAIQAGDWHAAWMAVWRQFLSRLENRQLVETDRTRTNREYLAQLHALSPPASALTLLNGMVDAYDRYIYGHRPIGEPDWNLFHQQVQEAALLLHLDDKRLGGRTKQDTA